MITTTDLRSAPALSHADAIALQRVELQRTIALLETLTPEQWEAPTACPDWNVHRMQLHILGACEGSASKLEGARQMRKALARRRRHGGPLEAAISFTQVQDRLTLPPSVVLERLRTVAPVTIRKREKTPGVIRRAKVKVDGPVFETWSFGYLLGTIYLRDLWMHRVDVCDATKTPLELTTDHDGRIVHDIVREWAQRHQQPFALELTGPLGGQFSAEDGNGLLPEPTVLDALDFCRMHAGRLPMHPGLFGTIVPF